MDRLLSKLIGLDHPLGGALHVGHYAGALENWVRLQDEYDCYFLIADYQALGDHFDDIDLIRDSVLQVTLDWLSVGLDPEKSTFVIQSYVPEHAELTTLLSFITPLGMLQRNPTLKAEMDALLLLHPTVHAVGYDGPGDFILAPEGRLRRRCEREVAPLVFSGIQMFHPRLFEGTPEGPFSLNLVYDKAAEAERLWGLRHDGDWFHIGTPENLRDVEDALHPLSEHSDQR